MTPHRAKIPAPFLLESRRMSERKKDPAKISVGRAKARRKTKGTARLRTVSIRSGAVCQAPPANWHKFLFRHEVSSAEHGRRLDLYARSHGRGNCDPIDKGPLGARG